MATRLRASCFGQFRWKAPPVMADGWEADIGATQARAPCRCRIDTSWPSSPFPVRRIGVLTDGGSTLVRWWARLALQIITRGTSAGVLVASGRTLFFPGHRRNCSEV